MPTSSFHRAESILRSVEPLDGSGSRFHPRNGTLERAKVIYRMIYRRDIANENEGRMKVKINKELTNRNQIN